MRPAVRSYRFFFLVFVVGGLELGSCFSRHEMSKAHDPLLHAMGNACIADTGYDAAWFNEET